MIVCVHLLKIGHYEWSVKIIIICLYTLKILCFNFQTVSFFDDFINRNVSIKSINIPQRLKKYWNFAFIVIFHQDWRQFLCDGNSKLYQSQTTNLNDNVKHKFNHLMRKTVNKVSEKPLEYPNRFVHMQLFI